METKDIRDVAQKHYDSLFEKMLQNEGKLKKGVMLLSYRPRPYCHTPEDIEKVLGEVENFLRDNIPGVKIPPRPATLQRVPCHSSF
ncbi:MAG: hypothetical protein A2Z52_00575 [Candidatus Moranbacteria bacterium RBG_19FT_COMBO_42_6]|nr:MAG: hypothetical protein A2Z52_00575 [Candidatus Moranbacteria bacterium RBG_19FT_COMBO_42_6]